MRTVSECDAGIANTLKRPLHKSAASVRPTLNECASRRVTHCGDGELGILRHSAQQLNDSNIGAAPAYAKRACSGSRRVSGDGCSTAIGSGVRTVAYAGV